MPRVVEEMEKEDEGDGGGGATQQEVVVPRQDASLGNPMLKALRLAGATAFTDGYQYRPSNTEIGRAAKESGHEYPVYKPGDRWLAWRLRTARRERAVEMRALRQRTSAGKKAGKKKQQQQQQNSGGRV